MSDINEEQIAEIPTPKKRRSKKKTVPSGPVDAREQAIEAARLADEKLGDDIVILDVNELTSYTSYIILITAKNARQTGGLASYLEDLFATKFNQKPMSREGVEGTGWTLLDFGDVIIHIFTEEERGRYDLDGFWKDAPHVDFSLTKK